MSSDKITELPKKSNKQKNYEWFCNTAERILEPHNIDYDVIELASYGQGVFGLKIFIADSGTYMFECDKQGYKEFLKETKCSILENPFKCPFCCELDPDDKCSKCGTMFTDDQGEFIKLLQKKTFIKSKCYELFDELDGNIKDIIDGIDVVYFKDSSYPTYCLSNKIGLKNIHSINKSSLNKFLVSYLMSKDDKYEKLNISDNWNEKEYVTYFNDEENDLEVMIFFEFEGYYEDNFEQTLKLGVGNGLQGFIDRFFPEKNIDVDDCEDEDEDYRDTFEDEMCGFDYIHDYKNHDYWWSFDVENLDTSKCNTLHEMASLLEKHIDESLKTFLKKTEEAVKNTINIVSK